MGNTEVPRCDPDHHHHSTRSDEMVEQTFRRCASVDNHVGAPRAHPGRTGISISHPRTILMYSLFIMLFLSIAAYTLGPVHASRPVGVESRGLDSPFARLSPRSFSNDTVGYFNTTTVINGTAVVTITETPGVQQTLASLFTITLTPGTQETTVSGVVGAEGVPVTTLTLSQTVIVTTQLVETIDDVAESHIINATEFMTLTEVVSAVSTVTHLVEPYPVSENAEEASQELYSDSYYISTQTLTSTLTLTNTEHVIRESSELVPETGHSDHEMESSTTTTTFTPTVTITHATITTTPIPITTVEATSTRVQTFTVEAENTIRVTETVEPKNTIFVTQTVEPVCGTEEVRYVTITETVHNEHPSSASSDLESTTSDALGQPGDPVMGSSEIETPEIQTITETRLSTSTSTSFSRTTIILSGPFLSKGEVTTSTPAPAEQSPSILKTIEEAENSTGTLTETLGESTQVTTVSIWTTITLSGDVVTVLITSTREVPPVEESSSSEALIPTTDVDLTEVITKTATEIVTDTSTATFWNSVISSIDVSIPVVTITQSVDVDLNEQPTPSTITQYETETINIEHSVAITSESPETQLPCFTVTEYRTQLLTETTTHKSLITGTSSEVREVIVTDVVVHTELVNVTLTIDAAVTAAPETSTVWVSAFNSTVASALGSVGNGTYQTPNATAIAHIEVSGVEKRVDSFQGGVAFSMVLAFIGLLVLF